MAVSGRAAGVAAGQRRPDRRARQRLLQPLVAAPSLPPLLQGLRRAAPAGPPPPRPRAGTVRPFESRLLTVRAEPVEALLLLEGRKKKALRQAQGERCSLIPDAVLFPQFLRETVAGPLDAELPVERVSARPFDVAGDLDE